jgi:VanZ family protein
LNSYQKNNLGWILWGSLILVLISIPGDFLPNIPKFMNLFEPDKLVHVFLFLVFIFLMLRGFSHKASPAFLRNNAFFLALLITIFIGGFTEIIQHFFIPGRTASLYDFIANVVGCFAGFWIYIKLAKRRKGEIVKK